MKPKPDPYAEAMWRVCAVLGAIAWFIIAIGAVS